MRRRRAGLGVPAQAEDDDLHAAAPEFQRLVAAPHVDVDVAALHLRAGVHDRVDAVVLLAQPVDLDDRPDREQVRVRRGDARPHVHARGGRRPLAVCGRREPQPGAGSGGGGRFADLRLPGRIAGVQRGHLIQKCEGDGGRGGRHNLAAGRSRQKHQFDLALGGVSTIPGRGPMVKGGWQPYCLGVPA